MTATASREEKFQASLAFARRYEQGVAAWLMRRGWVVLPTYDYSGKGEQKAPKLLAAEEIKSLVIPDLLVCRAGGARWVEVKYKEHADWTRLTQRFETGISKRLWDHYAQVEAQSGIEVWLVFVHEREAEMRGEPLPTLRKLNPRTYDGRKMGQHGMVFFPWEKLRRLASLSEVAP